MGVLEKNRRRGMRLGQEGNTLFSLIAANAIMFVLVNFIKIAFFLSGMDVMAYYNNVLSWMLVPPELARLVERPWALFTYMFTHDGVWHMISNMLWLWAFGHILQDLTGNRHMAPIYLYGGFAGALFFLATVNAFPVLSQNLSAVAALQGGGAAIMAIAVATTTLAPGYRIFPMLHGGIPLWVLTLVFVALDYALIAGHGAGVGVAHLSGGLLGFLYMRAMNRGLDPGAWMHQVNDWFLGLFDPRKHQARHEAIRREMFYKAGPPPFKATTKRDFSQQRIDEILDKISQKGFQHLSDEEKEYLKRASKEEL